MGFFNRLFGKEKKDTLDQGLAKSKQSFVERISRVFTGRRRIDGDLLDDLEEALVSSDLGIDTTEAILERLRKRATWEAYVDQGELMTMLREEVLGLIATGSGTRIDASMAYEVPRGGSSPHVIMIVGVNGVGKTTSIAKLAHRYSQQGLKVMLGAADTFRAAAVDQLKVWGGRVGVPVVAQGMGSDPAAVAFDTLQSAVAQHMDLVLIDTAGRLHNKVNLMNELGKIKRVMSKVIPEAPHEVWLVLDGSTGQNALEQAKRFSEVTEVTGLVLTKLDGTAKGGVVLAISDQMNVPVRFIGVGEKMEDLQDFHPMEFVDSLLPQSLDTES
ncbi:MAG: signal recognition particle-docking protein FtsY [Bacteroidetes bacterium]|nr:signal recognition particle-docking protein FtsY [Bacteroidota bacterium]MDA0904351.1 signal recognition particle-docking protein FtsY [Bacteroidota bacterium]MDA1243100.1 signal recognition particle-docking protein FtsY [Bacteroidota bacterium]